MRELDEAYTAIDRAIVTANKRKEQAEIFGEELNPHKEIIEFLKYQLHRVESIERHKHRWNDADYCSICGVDGRS